MENLTAAELERLAVLSEECGEVVQAIGKILRHGWESTYDNGRTNREQLEIEIADVAILFDLLLEMGDIDIQHLESAALAKRLRINKYLHHNRVEQ